MRHTHAVQFRALLAVTTLGLSAWFAVSSPPRLGLDLQGGTQIVLQAQDSPTVRADAEATDRALEVLRRRVDALGVAEPSLARAGDDRIIVELPGLQDPREAVAVIGRTAQLAFHPVLAPGGPAVPGQIELLDEQGARLRVGPATLTGDGVSGADAVLGRFATLWSVTLEFTGSGEREWQQLTAQAACSPPGTDPRRVAIVLDGEVISSPQVDPSVRCGTGILGGSTEITGDFSRAEAQQLATLIEGGALPVPVEVVEQRVVGPTLGAEAIEASAWAGVIGLSLTAVFLVVVYRLVGVLAVVGLASFGLIAFGALSAVGATLTLPGLAGLLLSAGLAIDANVLVFERAREEQLGGRRRSLARSLRQGYKHAWSAIADSNATTLLASGLLFYLASGPVRGFGVTLSIGVMASMLSALVVTRTLTDAFVRPRTRPGLSGLTGTGRVRRWLATHDLHLMRHRRRWLALSGIAVVLATSGIVVRGVELGVEFTGGRLLEYSTAQEVSAERAREAVLLAGFGRAVVQRSGDDDITVRTGTISDDQERVVRGAVESVGGTVQLVRDVLIGPSLGDELRTKALIALGVALAAQLLYLAVRFRATFAAGAVLAMLHDVLIVVGAFAWLGRTVDGVFLAAALAVIGISVNDSIVTLDRVREIRAKDHSSPLSRVCDRAILQTVPRTINTGLGAMFILACLALLGGDTLVGFALALLIGLVVGTWSSAFTAVPLLLALEQRHQKTGLPGSEQIGAPRPALPNSAPSGRL